MYNKGKERRKIMTPYQRSLMNKMDEITIALQEDWQYRTMTKKERSAKEAEYNSLKAKFEASYKK